MLIGVGVGVVVIGERMRMIVRSLLGIHIRFFTLVLFLFLFNLDGCDGMKRVGCIFFISIFSLQFFCIVINVMVVVGFIFSALMNEGSFYEFFVVGFGFRLL